MLINTVCQVSFISTQYEKLSELPNGKYKYWLQSVIFLFLLLLNTSAIEKEYKMQYKQCSFLAGAEYFRHWWVLCYHTIRFYPIKTLKGKHKLTGHRKLSHGPQFPYSCLMLTERTSSAASCDHWVLEPLTDLFHELRNI